MPAGMVHRPLACRPALSYSHQQKRRCAVVHARWSLLLTAVLALPRVAAAGPPTRVSAASGAALAEWSARVGTLEASRDLVSRQTRDDTMIPGRRHERLAQRYQGVPVWGGELVRQSDAAGTLTVFGTFYEGIDIGTTPTLRAEDAVARIAARGGRPVGR